MSQRDLDAALGSKATKTSGPTDAHRGRNCAWTIATGGATSATLTIATWQGKAFFAPDALGLGAVSGIGDAAAGDAAQGMLMVRKGDTVIQVLLFGFGDKASAVTAIAKAAADKA